MSSNNNENLSIEQLVAMQQRQIQRLEELLVFHLPPSSTSGSLFDDHMDNSSGATSLHSIGVRSTYNWTPSPILSEVLSLDKVIFATSALSDDQLAKIIERYPIMKNVQYQPLNTIPDAAHRMKSPEAKQDMSLKRLQYLISSIFRPLDILGHEISPDNEDVNVQRYLTILANCRALLLNLSSQVNDMRNTPAVQTINPAFKSTAAPTKNYTMPLADFQTTLAQQTTSAQALRNASRCFAR
jgi:hypothetical protein